MKTKNLKIGYFAISISIIVIYILNEIDNFMFTDYGINSAWVDFVFHIDSRLLFYFIAELPLIALIALTVVTRLKYKNVLTKRAYNILLFAFIPMLISDLYAIFEGVFTGFLVRFLNGNFIPLLILFLFRLIYCILVLIFMIKDIRKIS